MKYASRVAYDSTIGALKQGKFLIVDKLIVEPLYKVYQKKVRGRTSQEIDIGIKDDERKVKDFINKLTKKRNVGGKRANKTRKNLSRKNRK